MATTQVTAVAKRPIDTIRSLLEKSKSQIALALPKHLNADRIVRVTMTSIQRNPELLKCDPISLVAAVIQSSQLGLEPDGILGHAYLVPFFNRKQNKMEVQFIPGYKGLIDLARRSGQVNRISAHIVYENETFEMEYGTSEILEHKPLPPSKRGDRKGVYAVAVLKDGSTHFEWLWEEEIEKIKESVKASFGPWKTHEDEMVRKTAIRRLVKYLPLSVELAKASAIDELADAGVSTQEFFDDESLLPQVAQPAKTIDSAFAEIAQPKAENVIEQQNFVNNQPEFVNKTTENVNNQPEFVNKSAKIVNEQPKSIKEVDVGTGVIGGQEPKIGWFWCENRECSSPVPIDKNVTINTAMCPNCHQATLHEASENTRAGAANERLRFLQKKPNTAQQPIQPTLQAAKQEDTSLIDTILAYGIKPSYLTVYIVKAIGTNKELESLTDDEAKKVLNYIQSVKGVAK